MLDVSMEVSRADIRDLGDTLTRIQKQTGKSATSAVLWSARRVAKAGEVFAKKGKKTRKTRLLKVKGSKVRKLQMEVWTQKSSSPKWVTIGIRRGGKNKLALADPKYAKRVNIEKYLLSKMVWKAIGGRVGNKPRKGGRGLGRTVHANAKVRNRLRKHDPEVTMTNRLTYQDAAFPGIERHAIKEGTKALNHQLDLNLEKDLQRETNRLMRSL